MAYLQALGIDSYVSRGQMPGAGPSRRLALTRSRAASTAPAAPGEECGAARQVPRVAARAAPPPAAVPQRRELPASPAPTSRFTLSAIVAGALLWLEDLGDMPLAADQVRLVRAMAHALAVDAGQASPGPADADIGRFDWPMHNNQQLDNSEEAARAGLDAFLQRRMEQHGCRGLVLLGAACGRWVDAAAFGAPVVQTRSTADMLSDPACKVQVWRELAPLRARQ
ncbi:MAG: hypothetical protein R3228_03385 [Halioglobus sp.]|nr:hypothetical protein [Halioglobus sp.]